VYTYMYHGLHNTLAYQNDSHYPGCGLAKELVELQLVRHEYSMLQYESSHNSWSRDLQQRAVPTRFSMGFRNTLMGEPTAAGLTSDPVFYVTQPSVPYIFQWQCI